MSRQGADVVIVCEDLQHEVFFGRLLVEMGHSRMDVSEQDTYPKLRDRERDCQPAVARFAEMAQGPAPADGCLPSLVRGLAEVKRLP